MTAEVAVLNRHAIALAADSAVTIMHSDGAKVFNSANKLFALKHAPVGIMIYGEADFMGVPWEPLIKVYRSTLARTKFPTVADYADHFLGFLKDHKLMQSAQRQDTTFGRRALQFLLPLVTRSRDLYFAAEAEAANRGTPVDVPQEINAAVTSAVHEQDAMLDPRRPLSGFDPTIVSKREKLVVDGLDRIFAFIPGAAAFLSDPTKKSVVALFTKAMERSYFPSSSGVVLAGYGEEEMFPALVSLELDGVYDGYLRNSREQDAIDETNTAVLQPFAQGDVVSTFMDGIHPRLDDLLNQAIVGLMSNLTNTVASRMSGLTPAQDAQLRNLLATAGAITVNTFGDFLAGFRRTNHGPITQALDVMPKEELAELAESLVHLTSTRRRVAMETESVGGPIDVAVISKGDGFIWLKRKHYFKPELNPQFFTKMLEQR